jgi:hypothetical protein
MHTYVDNKWVPMAKKNVLKQFQDQNFRPFEQFFEKKKTIGGFHENNEMITFCSKISSVWVKIANFFLLLFSETICRIDPSDRSSLPNSEIERRTRLG